MCGLSSARKKVLWPHPIFEVGAGAVTPVLCPALSSCGQLEETSLKKSGW